MKKKYIISTILFITLLFGIKTEVNAAKHLKCEYENNILLVQTVDGDRFISEKNGTAWEKSKTYTTNFLNTNLYSDMLYDCPKYYKVGGKKEGKTEIEFYDLKRWYNFGYKSLISQNGNNVKNTPNNVPPSGCNPAFAMDVSKFSGEFDKIMANFNNTMKYSGVADNTNYCIYGEKTGYYPTKTIYVPAGDEKVEKIIFAGETAEDVYNTIYNGGVWDDVFKSYCKSNPGTNSVCQKLSDEANNSDSDDKNIKAKCKYNFDYEGNEAPFEVIIDKYDSVYIEEGIKTNINDQTHGKSMKIGKNNLYFQGRDSTVDEFKTNFLEAYNKAKTCPEVHVLQSGKNKKNWYLSLNADDCKNTGLYSGKCLVTNNGVTKKLVTFDSLEFDKLIGGENDVKVCKDLIKGDLKKLLKGIVNVVKILVPIALLVLGILDFTQAIFSSNEDGMKKAQGKFMKRLIIVVIIFLIPTILRVVLSIANTIWPVVSSDLCGIL